LTGKSGNRREWGLFLRGSRSVAGETGSRACGSGALQPLVLGGPHLGERPREAGESQN
jgi:hypothetical protein